jgi:hypothetical protein
LTSKHFPRRLNAIHARHAYVSHHHVWMQSSRRFDQSLAITYNGNYLECLTKQITKLRGDMLMVVRENDCGSIHYAAHSS